MTELSFRSYKAADKDACLAIFDANCPEFFAPNEREDYIKFLQPSPIEYEVCIAEQALAGAFGIFPKQDGQVSLNWILLNPGVQGLGIGSKIMSRAIAMADAANAESMQIAASHKSAPFFEKFGAIAEIVTEDGWGPGMHRIDMVLRL